ncbi:MAG: AsmA-like C-terminal region-containing protein [Flavobacteriales bacterium]
MFRKKRNSDGTPKKKKSLFRRILKWTGISFLILLIGLIVTPFIFEKQIFEYVKSEINRNLNAKFDCNDYSLTIFSSFPNLTLELKEVDLKGIEEFKDIHLVKAKSILVTLDIWSVMFGDKMKIKRVGFSDGAFHALALDSGKVNWDIAKPSPEPDPETGSTESNFALKLSKYYIENMDVIYDDRPGSMYVEIKDLDHEGKGDFTSDKMLLETVTKAKKITYSMGGVPFIKEAKGDIKFDIDIDMSNPATMKMAFKQNKVVLNELALSFDGWMNMDTTGNMELDIKWNTKETKFKNLFSMVPAVYTSDFSSIKINGDMAFNGFVKGKMNEKSMPAFEVKMKVNNGSFQYPGLPKSATAIFVDATVNAKGDPTMDDMVIDIPKISMSLGGNALSAFFHMTNPMTDPGLNAGMKTKLLLATLKDVVPVAEGEDYSGSIDVDAAIKGRMSSLEKGDYENFTATGNIILDKVGYKTPDGETMVDKGIFALTPAFVDMPQLDARFDKTELHSKGKLENYLAYLFKDGVIKGNLDLASPYINLGDFMSSGETAATTETKAATPAAEDPNANYVVEVPGNVDFTLASNITKLVYPGSAGTPDLEMDNVSGQVVIRDKKLSLAGLKMNTLGGSVVLNGSYETVNPAEPKVDMKYTIKDLDIKKTSETFVFVQKMAPIASKCTGRFSSTFDMQSALTTKMEPKYPTMTGDGSVAARNIFIDGFEPLNKLAQELKIQKLAKQNVEDVAFDFYFKDGKVFVKEHKVKLGKYDTKISGNTAFTSEIDYDMVMNVPRSDFGSGANNALNSLVAQASKKGVDVKLGETVDLKIKMTGTVKDPKVKTDLKEVADQAKADVKEDIKETVKEKVEEVKEDLKGKAKAEAEKILKDAQEKADKVKAEGKKAADKERALANEAADKVVKEAEGKNIIAKKAAEKSAEKIRKEGEEKAKKIENEANAKADAIMVEAREKASKIENK